MIKLICKYSEKGASLLEYPVLLFTLAVLTISAVRYMGRQNSEFITSVGVQIQQAPPGFSEE